MALTQIGKYQIIKQLGQGGFGAVYLAEAPGLNTQVAIKVFSISDPQQAQQATSATSEAGQILRERFLNEARILRDLESNPNIVNIYDFDQLEDGTPYYVMPYLTHSLVDDIGKDALTALALKELDPELRPRKLPVSEVTRILEQVLSGLKAVHKVGLIHRDIKPANILFDKHGNAQLCDFGIAKAPDAEHSHTGMAMGSRNYMSPEQRVSAKHVTPRSDVYSVGVMGYRMLTGTLPVGRYADPIALSPNIGEALNELLLAAINDEPEERPIDAGEFLKRLQQAIETIDANAPEVSEHTATEMGDAPQAISNELKPLQDKIQGFLLAAVTLTDEQRKQLTLAAGVLGVSTDQLDSLIAATEKQMEPQLTPLRNFIATIDGQLADSNGELSDADKSLLIQVAEQAGQKRETLEALLADRIAAFVKQKPIQEPPSEPKQQPPKEAIKPKPEQPQTKAEKPKSKTPLVGAAALVLLAGGGYLYTQNNKISDESTQMQAPVMAKKPDVNPDPVEAIPEQVVKPKPKPQPVETYQLWVNVQPANAQIKLQGTGKTYSPGMLLPAGSYKLSIFAKDHHRKQLTVDLTRSSQKLNIELDKVIKTYQLWVETNAKGAKVILPDIGPAYSPGMELEAGKYRVKIKAPGYKIKTQWVDLTSANQRVSMQLEKLPQAPKGFVAIPAGSFQMGSHNGDADEKPVHRVSVKSFYLQEREVTFAEWDQCVSAGGCSYKPSSSWGRGSQPVMRVSYNDITQQYIPWLNRKTGHNYRLPTEAEWEYAARAGSTTKYSWGNSINCSQARYGHYEGDCGNERKTVPVKSFSANNWGLYDMHGNVWEWTADCWNDSYAGAPSNGSAWKDGDCSRRVLRGGSWYNKPLSLRSAYRGRYARTERVTNFGFRLARDK